MKHSEISEYTSMNSEHLPIDEGAGVHDLIDKLVLKLNELISLDHANVVAASKLVD